MRGTLVHQVVAPFSFRDLPPDEHSCIRRGRVSRLRKHRAPRDDALPELRVPTSDGSLPFRTRSSRARRRGPQPARERPVVGRLDAPDAGVRAGGRTADRSADPGARSTSGVGSLRSTTVRGPHAAAPDTGCPASGEPRSPAAVSAPIGPRRTADAAPRCTAERTHSSAGIRATRGALHSATTGLHHAASRRCRPGRSSNAGAADPVAAAPFGTNAEAARLLQRTSRASRVRGE